MFFLDSATTGKLGVLLLRHQPVRILWMGRGSHVISRAVGRKLLLLIYPLSLAASHLIHTGLNTLVWRSTIQLVFQRGRIALEVLY